MTRIVEVPLEPLSDEAFAPFGQIIGKQDRKPLFEGTDVKTWTVDFRIEGTLDDQGTLEAQVESGIRGDVHDRIRGLGGNSGTG